MGQRETSIRPKFAVELGQQETSTQIYLLGYWKTSTQLLSAGPPRYVDRKLLYSVGSQRDVDPIFVVLGQREISSRPKLAVVLGQETSTQIGCIGVVLGHRETSTQILLYCCSVGPHVDPNWLYCFSARPSTDFGPNLLYWCSVGPPRAADPNFL